MISIAKNKLFGQAGGQLEYVSQRLEWRKYPDGQSYQVVVIRFTDHDHQGSWCTEEMFPQLIEGKYYELEFPLAGY